MDKELIDHIKTKLQQHDEFYSSGAWERFSEKENKGRGFVYWPLWIAAALILVFGGTFLVLDNQYHKQDLVIEKPKAIEKNIPSQVDNDEMQKITRLKPSNAPLVKGHQVQNRLASSNNQQKSLAVSTPENTNDRIIEIGNPNILSNSLANIPLTSYGGGNFKITAERKKEKLSKKSTFEDLLAHDSKINELKTATKSSGNSKWEPGVYVAPAMGNDNKLNMNYGFSLSFNLGSKLSIGSGIAYSSLSSTSNPSSQNGNPSDAIASSMPASGTLSSYSSNNVRSLESVKANVRGINIPLELKYNISNKFYTGVGVSALAVLNNRQDNNYLVSSGKNVTVANSAGVTEQRMLIVTERISEPQTQSLNLSDKYIGFYNFSLGYKQKISKKTDFAIEPFLRLPMKTFSNENLNLTNGGLRLKIDF
jgi:hypothetical protein